MVDMRWTPSHLGADAEQTPAKPMTCRSAASGRHPTDIIIFCDSNENALTELHQRALFIVKLSKGNSSKASPTVFGSSSYTRTQLSQVSQAPLQVESGT
jgi:hypothetical protein